MNRRAHLRSQVYAVLSVALSPPCEGMGVVGGLQAAAQTLLEATGALAVPIPKCVLDSLEDAVRQAISNLAQGANGGLEAEYNRLFVGPGAPRIYPYESLYQDSTGLVMGPSAAAVLQAYRQGGLAINTRYKDLPDHIAVELEFMARLCAKEAQAASGTASMAYRPKEDQRSFLTAHLATWLPPLCERVMAETSLAVYRALAEIAAIFVRWDVHELYAEQLSGTESSR